MNMAKLKKIFDENDDDNDDLYAKKKIRSRADDYNDVDDERIYLLLKIGKIVGSNGGQLRGHLHFLCNMR